MLTVEADPSWKGGHVHEVGQSALDLNMLGWSDHDLF
jgi:hypothetical protein